MVQGLCEKVFAHIKANTSLCWQCSASCFTHYAQREIIIRFPNYNFKLEHFSKKHDRRRPLSPQIQLSIPSKLICTQASVSPNHSLSNKHIKRAPRVAVNSRPHYYRSKCSRTLPPPNHHHPANSQTIYNILFAPASAQSSWPRRYTYTYSTLVHSFIALVIFVHIVVDTFQMRRPALYPHPHRNPPKPTPLMHDMKNPYVTWLSSIPSFALYLYVYICVRDELFFCSWCPLSSSFAGFLGATPRWGAQSHNVWPSHVHWGLAVCARVPGAQRLAAGDPVRERPRRRQLRVSSVNASAARAARLSNGYR